MSTLTATASTTSEAGTISFLANKKQYLSLLIAAALVVLWLGGALFAFYLKQDQLLMGLDGGYMMDRARRQFEWQMPLLWSGMDWFQGLGDIFVDVNFRLLPSTILGFFLSNQNLTKIAIYEVLICELSLGTILFGLSLGASRTAAITAGVVTCLVFLPFATPTLIYGILNLSPHIGSFAAIALMAAAAFLRFGRRTWQSDLPFALTLIGLLGWSALSSITIMLLSAPFLLLSAVSGIVAAASPAERRCKIAL